MESMKIGFIGLGMMGKPMAARLLDAGFTLRVYNRTREKAGELIEKGAEWCESPKAVMHASDVVISMVSDPQALEAIALGTAGLIEGSVAGKIHIDMSTVSPQATMRLEQTYRLKQGLFLHAPVLGSVPNAAEGTLLIFVGGDPNGANRCHPIFNRLGWRVWYFDEVAKATHVKLICKLFIASMITALSEGLVLGQKAGIGASTILEILKESALNAPMYETKGAAIQRRDFTPRFMVAHMLKDLNLIHEAVESVGVPTLVVDTIRDLFRAADGRGLQKEDYSAVVKVLEEAAGTEVKG